MPDTPVSHLQIHRALKVILSINYKWRWLDAYISPERIEWAAAVSFKNDPQRIWRPKLMYFYPKEQRVAVFNKLGEEPLWIEASVIMAMAAHKDEMKEVPPPTA